jgi:hypothetical protein
MIEVTSEALAADPFLHGMSRSCGCDSPRHAGKNCRAGICACAALTRREGQVTTAMSYADPVDTWLSG